MSNSIRLQMFRARARRPYSRLIAGLAGFAMLGAAVAPGSACAGGPVFTPNNLVVSRSVYAGTASTITIGQTLPPGCTAGVVKVPLIVGGTTNVTIPSGPSGCNTSPGALFNGTYPFVFNNDTADSHFGITAPIFLDQLTTGGALLNSLPIDSTMIDTSFSSKSELAVNRSVDGLSITFMGYVAGPGFTTAPNVLDVSNGNTPGLIDPTNPAVSQYYRSVAEVDAFGTLQITKGNAYSGDNGRAAIKGGNSLYYMSGNDNQGNLSKKQLSTTQVGVNLVDSTGAELLIPGQTPPLLPPNIDMLGTLLFDSDKPGKDTNFRGVTIFDNTLYVTKGSGGNGVNTVYQVGTAGTLPAAAIPPGDSNLSLPITILPGFPNTGTSTFPFGMWFANANTLYVADEGTGTIGTVDTTNAYDDALVQNGNTGGLQKWVFNGTSWNLAYTLTNGLGLGVPYTVASYPTGVNSVNGNTNFPSGLPWAPAPDGLRNITGRVNTDGTVNIWAITSTISGNGDQGADPNQLVFVTDELADTSSTPPSSAQFAVLETAGNGEVLRGVSFAPGATAAAPSSGNTCDGVYDGTFQGNLTVSTGQNCVFIGGAINGNVTLDGGNLSLTNTEVGGNVQLHGGGAFSIGPSATINGNLQVQNVPAGTGQDEICDSDITGNVEFHNSETPAEIGSSSPTCAGNILGGNLQVQNNSADVTVIDNSVKGNVQFHNNDGQGTISDNSIGGNLQCQNDTPPASGIAGSNNVGGNKQGECSGL